MSARWLGGFHALLFSLSLLSSMGLGPGSQNLPVYARYNFCRHLLLELGA